MSKKLEEQAVTFDAIFVKASITADKGWRVVFDLSEHSADVITRLADIKESTLRIAAIPLD